MSYKKIKYNNKYYAVVPIKYKNNKFPIVLDWNDFLRYEKINDKFNMKWKCNQYGFISSPYVHSNDNDTGEVFLHEIVMARKMMDDDLKIKNKPIIHVNRIGLDNRRKNLIYDEVGKEIKKNSKKKKRTIKLPKESGIRPDEIPTYVWYMKPNGTHGERFMIHVDDVKWKTTASKKLSLRYKLEEAKKYLRELKKERPEIFDEYSMNGDYNFDGKKLLNEYYDIVELANYKNIQRDYPQNNTKDYLKPGKLSRSEYSLLKKQINLLKGGKNRRIINKLPKNCGVRPSDLPKYVYYRDSLNNRGPYFIISGHPKLNGKVWQSSSSKKLSVLDKFNMTLDFYDDL